MPLFSPVEEIDKQIREILRENRQDKRPLHGLMTVYTPLAEEVRATRVYLASQRKKMMRELYERENEQYANEIAAKNLFVYYPKEMH